LRTKETKSKSFDGIWRRPAENASGLKKRLWSYHHHTKGPLTGFLMGFVLSLIYYVGTIIKGFDSAQGGSFFIGFQYRTLGSTGYALVQLGLLVTFLVVVILMQRKGRFEFRYFLPLILESFFYALLLTGIMAAAVSWFGLTPHKPPIWNRAGAMLAAVGEAVNEETVFRWILLPVLLWIGMKIKGIPRWLRHFLAVFLAALTYALVAYFTGSQSGVGKTFSGLLTFLLLGLILSYMYIARGYTVCVWTHLFYALYWAGTADVTPVA